MGAGLAGAGAGTATAVSNQPNTIVFQDQTFYVYTAAGELPFYSFGRNSNSPTTGYSITVTDPSGAVRQTCTIPAGGPNVLGLCEPQNLTSVAGVWSIFVDVPSFSPPYVRYTIEARSPVGTPIPGRVWIERDALGHVNTASLTYWVGTREGYLYRVDMPSINGMFWALRSNGFGLVEDGTCTPVYRSVQGTQIGGDLAAGYDYSDACGDSYKLFLEQPAADLPATAPIAGGTAWIRPAVVPPSVTNLRNLPDNPYTRAGDLVFELAGVNGGYTIQVDADDNGSYNDPVDRTIPWGSPPGTVTVPFDGLDGLGQPIGICDAVNARVVIDRVGETHFVLEDVENMGGGIRITGATPGVIAANPKVYWDDRSLVPGTGQSVIPGPDGRAGVDTSTLAPNTGTHRWGNWGDNRSIENWTYYQAQAGPEFELAAACEPGISLEKVGELDDRDGDGFADAGETIAYTFVVTNTGNAPVSGVTVDDPRVTGITPASADIPILGRRTFTAEPYTVSQADVDAGGVPNTATAFGYGPDDQIVLSNEDSSFVPTPPRIPGLELDKVAELDDANGNQLADLGETIEYTFEVTNTGSVTVTDVSITDPRVTGVTPAAATIAPGDSATFTAASYVVTQADLNTGAVVNTAVADGTTALGPVRSNTDSETIPTPLPNPLLELEKSAVISTDLDGDGFADPGDTITYTFHVTNTGNVDLEDVTVIDPRLSGPTTPVAADIAANGSADFTGTYVATQADVDVGSIPNTAHAEGTYDGPDGAVEVVSAPDTAIVPTPERAPAITIEKDGVLEDGNGNGVADAGETIDYTFTVRNTGNVTVENVNVVDDRVNVVAPATATLAPGGTGVFQSVDYVVTQADVDAGEVLNTAFARGNVPGGAEIFSATDDDTQPVAAAAPALTIDKVAMLDDVDGDGIADEGEEIAYTFAVTNTGNVTLTDVTVVDDRIAALIPASIDVLPPTVTFTFEADPYTVTAADVEAGEIVNVAHATGVDPGGDPIRSDDDDATVSATPPGVPTPATGAGMANTGVVSWPWTVGAVALLLLGGAAVVASRARRSRP